MLRSRLFLAALTFFSWGRFRRLFILRFEAEVFPCVIQLRLVLSAKRPRGTAYGCGAVSDRRTRSVFDLGLKSALCRFDTR